MAVRKVWLGSTGPFLYDDSVLYIDEDGVISPDNQQAIATDGQIVIQSPPSSPVHAVRKQDLDDAVGDISSLETRVDSLEDTTAGLGSMAAQDSNSVVITGGTVSGLTQLEVVGSCFLDSNTLVVDAPNNRVGIRTYSPTRELHVEGTALFRSLEIPYNRGVSHAAVFTPNSDTGNYALYFVNAALTGVGFIGTTSTATIYATSSDARLKHTTAPLINALDIIRALHPITYRSRLDDSPGVGFLAHEVQEVVDGVVTGEKDAVDKEGQIMPQMIDYSKLVPWLTAALQELSQQVKDLTARVAALEVA